MSDITGLPARISGPGDSDIDVGPGHLHVLDLDLRSEGGEYNSAGTIMELQIWMDGGDYAASVQLNIPEAEELLDRVGRIADEAANNGE